MINIHANIYLSSLIYEAFMRYDHTAFMVSRTVNILESDIFDAFAPPIGFLSRFVYTREAASGTNLDSRNDRIKCVN